MEVASKRAAIEALVTGWKVSTEEEEVPQKVEKIKVKAPVSRKGNGKRQRQDKNVEKKGSAKAAKIMPEKQPAAPASPVVKVKVVVAIKPAPKEEKEAALHTAESLPEAKKVEKEAKKVEKEVEKEVAEKTIKKEVGEKEIKKEDATPEAKKEPKKEPEKELEKDLENEKGKATEEVKKEVVKKPAKKAVVRKKEPRPVRRAARRVVNKKKLLKKAAPKKASKKKGGKKKGGRKKGGKKKGGKKPAAKKKATPKKKDKVKDKKEEPKKEEKGGRTPRKALATSREPGQTHCEACLKMTKDGGADLAMLETLMPEDCKDSMNLIKLLVDCDGSAERAANLWFARESFVRKNYSFPFSSGNGCGH